MTSKRKRFSYEYERPSVTVDAVVFGCNLNEEDAGLEILLIERADNPFKGHLALPGGFVEMATSLEENVARELQEETGLTDVFLEQLYTYGAPRRDPRDRVISVAYYALVDRTRHRPVAGSDARRAEWYPVNDVLLKSLAFDHSLILKTAVQRLRGKLSYAPIGFELLPEVFTLTTLQRLYETILDRRIDRMNFRKKILDTGVLTVVGREERVSHRPAATYRFDRKKYKTLVEQGFSFEI